MKTWILVADAARGFLYDAEYPHQGGYELCHTFHHDESREKGCDLNADRSGHYQTSHAARSTYEHTDPKDAEAEKFMCELAHYLIHERKQQKFEDLIVVMPAHLYGVFEKHAKKHLNIIQYVSKDYTQEPVENLEVLLRV